MTEKISIFDVEISCIKAKEAMMQAIGSLKDDSVNTIELVSMESLMKEHENPEWKKKGFYAGSGPSGKCRDS